MKKIYLKYLFFCVFVILFVWSCSQQTYDLVIHNGTIVDGSGIKGYQASVGITDGKIARIGKIRTSQGIQAIDAGGKYVVPGFIDMHTHCENIRSEKRKAALNYLTQGVTTVVSGNCGSGTYDALPHPRSYGTFPRKIRRYVLEKNLLTMEQAIRSASGLPAEMLGLTHRGLIKEGYVADVVVFGPETIADKATFDDPHQYSEGILHVLISGVSAIKNGESTGALAGSPLIPRLEKKW